jgi:hypothetical protein
MAKDLAKALKNEVAVSEGFEAFDGIGTGLENVTARELLIPRLAILQSNNPQVTQGQSEFDKDARVGEIYDIGLRERFPGGIIFIPVFYQTQWLEWAPRDSKKGLQKIHDTDKIMEETEKDETSGKYMLANGNHIMETMQFYGLNVTAEFRKSFLPMASTQLKKGRRLLTLATSEKMTRKDGSQFTPPLFYRSYALGSVPESNNKGNWMGWTIERGSPLTDFDRWQQLMAEIKEFREQLASGTVKGDIASMEEEASKTIDHENEQM